MKPINDILQLFTLNNKVDTINGEEDVLEFHKELELDDINVPDKNELIRLLGELPSRDEMTISIIVNDMDPAILYSKKLESIDEFITTLSAYKEAKHKDSPIKFYIKVIKNIDDQNAVTIYSFETFMEFLEKNNPSSLFNYFHKLLTTRHTISFYTYDTSDSFYTKSLFFMSDTDLPFDRKPRLEKRNEVCNLLMANENYLTPDDFLLVKRSKNEKLNSLLDNLCSLLSLIYLSNFSNLLSDRLIVKMTGYKSIENTILYPKELPKIYYRIYEWTYSEGNINDKIEIARNIITLHAKNNDLLKVNDSTYDSIKSGHKLYLKENVEKYLEVKNKVTEFIVNESQKTSNIINSLSTSFTSNSFVFLSFFISVIVINSLSSSDNFSNIFSWDITYISYALISISLLYLLFKYWEINQEADKLFSDLSFLKTNYSDVLEEDDLDRILPTEVGKEHKKLLSKKLKVYFSLWVTEICIIFVLVLILSGDLSSFIYFISSIVSQFVLF